MEPPESHSEVRASTLQQQQEQQEQQEQQQRQEQQQSQEDELQQQQHEQQEPQQQAYKQEQQDVLQQDQQQQQQENGQQQQLLVPQEQQQQQQQRGDSLEARCPCRSLLQQPNALGPDGLFEDPHFPQLVQLHEGETTVRSSLLEGLLWKRPDEIVLRMQQQQAKAQRSARPQQQQQQEQQQEQQQQEQQQQQQQQQDCETPAILFSSSRPASTATQGLLPSLAFVAAASGLAVSKPHVLGGTLLHPRHWRERGILCAAFYRTGEREATCIDTRLPCCPSILLKDAHKKPRASTRKSHSSSSRKSAVTALQPAAAEEQQTSARGPPAAAAAAASPAASGDGGEVSERQLSGLNALHEKRKGKATRKSALEAGDANLNAEDSPIEFAFSHCHATEEVWLPLLEKAYAKFLGSYEALVDFGRAFRDILVDLTGGVVEEATIAHFGPDILWAKLRRVFSQRNSFLSCCAEAGNAEADGILPNRHYTIVDVVRVEDLRLLRLHNPWKVPTWRGEFSDYHRSWTQYPDLKEKLNYKFGETPAAFWMPFESFLSSFTTISLCHFLPPKERRPFKQSEGAPGAPPTRGFPPHHCLGETASDVAVSEVWGYEEGWEAYVSTCRDSWRGWSLCGLPRLWSRTPSAAIAAAAGSAGARTPEPTSRPPGSNSSSGSSSKGLRRTSKACMHTTVSQTWAVQQQGPHPHAAADSLCLDSSYLRSPTLPRTSAAAAALAAAVAAAADEPLSAIRSKESAAFEAYAGSVAAAAAAAGRSCSSSTPRGCTYTAVSRPSAFVRYEPQSEGFDMAWVNAPMFLISIPPTTTAATAAAAAGAAAAAAGDAGAASGPLQQSLEQQRALQLQQQQLLHQTEQQPLEMLLSVTQSCSLDVAPVSLAVFRARESGRIWSSGDAKLLGIAQSVSGDSEETPLPGKGWGCCYFASGMRGALVASPAGGGPWRDSCLRISLTESSECTRRLLVVCYQNLAQGEKLKANDFVFRSFSSHPLLVKRLPPPQHYEFSGVWTRSTGGGRLLTLDSRRRHVFNSKWPTNPQFVVHADPRAPETTLCIFVTREKAKRKNDHSFRVGLVVARLRDSRNPGDVEEVMSTSAFQPSQDLWGSLMMPAFEQIDPDEWFVESLGGNKCSLKLTVLSGAGPLVVSPCLEAAEATGAFSLKVFSDIPLERVEELQPSSHKVFVGKWEGDTAGGSLDFPSQLAMREAQKRAVECSEEMRKWALSLGALEGGPGSSRSSKQLPGRWLSNPLYLVVSEETAEETAQVEVTLARHDDCWATQKEQARLEAHAKPLGFRVWGLGFAGKDMAGCMMALYFFKGRTVNTGALVARTDFETAPVASKDIGDVPGGNTNVL
ncbi:hypothetical protein Esti_005277 [Eimeria stiedai]